MVYRKVTGNEKEDSKEGRLTWPTAPTTAHWKRSCFIRIMPEHKGWAKEKKKEESNGSPVLSKNNCKKTVGNSSVVKKKKYST